jgi:spermidine synthase
MGKINLWLFLIPIIVFTLIFLVVAQKASFCRKLSFSSIRNIPIPIAIATTGFVGMTFDIVLILAFQSFYGYVYHQLGLLVTAFMVGLTGGGWLMLRIMDKFKSDRLSLARIDLFIALYCVLLPIMLIFFNAYIAHPLIFSSVGIIILVLSAISGFLVGLQFPLANKILLSASNNISSAAGILYASDLLGACLAGLIASVVFIPVLGIVNTCILAFAMKLASFVVQNFGKEGAPKRCNS